MGGDDGRLTPPSADRIKLWAGRPLAGVDGVYLADQPTVIGPNSTLSGCDARGKLKTYAKTARSRRRVPLRAKVIAALATLPNRDGALFPAAGGGRIDINNWRSREWTPALKAAGVEHRRIYDMRHPFATWSLAAGMSIFTLARRMGTSVPVIDATYGHLAIEGDGNDRELLGAYDEANGHVVGTNPGDLDDNDGPQKRRNRAGTRFLVMGAAGFEPATSRV